MLDHIINTSYIMDQPRVGWTLLPFCNIVLPNLQRMLMSIDGLQKFVNKVRVASMALDHH